jgi:hypothetical protein
MKRIGNVSVMLMLAAMMAGFSGCGEDEEDNHLQLDPDHLSGTTDANGTVTLDLAQYDIVVNVTAGGAAAAGAAVELFQGNQLAMVWADLPGYYSNFSLLDLNTVDGDQNLAIGLIPAGIEYYEWDVDPALFGTLYSDDAYTEHCVEGNLQAIYSLVQSWESEFVFFRVYGNGASLRDGNISVGFNFSTLSYEAFEQVAFGYFGFIPQDEVEFCYYTLEIDGTTYALPTLHIGTIVEQGTAYDYKFILTWGDEPRDLDSHLFTPEIEGGTHHVYYGNSGAPSVAPYAWLDVDDTSSYGPEVVTIEALHPGTYQYSIYEYSGANTLTESQAVVQVFHGRVLIGTYEIPVTPQAGDNWWWNVGTVDGTTGAFTLVNTVTAGGPEGVSRPSLPAKIR